MINIDLKSQTGKIIINDFFTMNLLDKNNKSKVECAKIYNFNNQNRVLEKGLGLRSLAVHRANDVNSNTYELDYQSLNLEYFNKVMHFKQYFSNTGDTTHRLLFHGSDNKLYVYQMFEGTNTLNWTYEMSFTSIPIVLEYKKDGLDSILISANDKLIVWSTGRVPYELTQVPTITSMCVYNDILFCTIAGESDQIWYTTNLDPEKVGTESETTKYVLLNDERGACRKILTFKENVYIFRDYGISRLNDYTKNQPTYNQIYLSDSKIYANTIRVCGDFVVFMTRDGIYKFNGNSVSKFDVLPSELLMDINDYAISTNLQDKYYVALRHNFNDDKIIGCESETDMKNNVLIKLDLQDNTFEIMRGVDVKDMLALKAEFEEKIIVTFNSSNKDKIAEITNDGMYFDEILPREYCSNYIIQEDIEELTIRKIKIEASKNVELNIITDQTQYVFNTCCDGINEFQTIIPCKKFKIEINSTISEPYINTIQLEYVKRK